MGPSFAATAAVVALVLVILTGVVEPVAAVATITANATYCTAAAGEEPFTRACVAAALAELAASAESEVVLLLPPGLYNDGGCNFTLPDASVTVDTTGPPGGLPAVFECDGDASGFSWTGTGVGLAVSISNVEIRNVNAVSAVDAAISISGAAVANLSRVSVVDAAGLIRAGVALVGLSAEAVVSIDGLVCDRVSTSFDRAGACLYIPFSVNDAVSVSVANTTMRRCQGSCIFSGQQGQYDVSNCTFADSTAWVGAALQSEHNLADVRIVGSSFHNLSASSRGGAVSTFADLVLTDSNFIRTTSLGDGGAVCSRQGAVDVDNCRFDECMGLSGGALFVELTLMVNDAEFRNCSASDRGGAMSVGSVAILFDVVIVGSTARSGGGLHTASCVAVGLVCNDTTASGGHGGCMLSLNGVVFDDVSMARCRATGSGGGLHVNSDVALSHSEFRNCTAGGSGGALAIKQADVLINNAEVIGCEAGGSGGGIYVDAPSGEFDGFLLVIRGNTAGGFGGGLAVRSAVIDLHTADIDRNAAQNGGGLALIGQYDASSAAVRDNTATRLGGGMYVENGGCEVIANTMSAFDILNNTAGEAGGGLFADVTGGNTIADSTVAGNAAPTAAGIRASCQKSLCFDGELTCANASLALSSTNVSSNGAFGGSGGGIVVEGDMALTFSGLSSVSQNSASQSGGGFFVSPAAAGRMDPLSSLVGGTDGNTAPNGPLRAGPPAQTFFAPVSAPTTDVAMSGADLCPSSGCVVQVQDSFNQTAIAPVLVEFGLVSFGGPLELDAPLYVLVADGLSAPFEGVSVALTADPGSGSDTIAATMGLKLEAGEDWSSTVAVSVGACAPGWGVAASDGDDLVCTPCAVGYYAGAASLEACLPCPAGTSNNATASSECFEDDADPDAVVVSATPWWVWVAIVAGVAALVACVGVIAWRKSRSVVISNYYIDEDATVTIDDKFLSRKINVMLQDSYAKRIGGGEFTDIYRVREKKDVFVLKLLKVNLEGSGTARAEFDSEARILAQLQARVHPGVIRARFFTSSSPVCIGLDFCAGGTLKDHVGKSSLPATKKLMFAAQIASSMSYIHSKGIAHLDLKTTNILLSADRRSTVIADFGISQTRDGIDSIGGSARSNPVFGSESSGVAMVSMGSMTGPGLALTPHYCAPERLMRKDLSFDELLAADVYTYGVVVWIIYSQTEPYAGVSGDDVIAAIKADPEARHDIPNWTDHVVRRLIEQCWAGESASRPSFDDVSAVLSERYCSDEIGGQAAEVYL